MRHPTQLCRDYVINHDIRIPINQPGFSSKYHQKFQITKNGGTELNLISGYFGGFGFPLHEPYLYSLYRFLYHHFRYLKCLVTMCRTTLLWAMGISCTSPICPYVLFIAQKIPYLSCLANATTETRYTLEDRISI